MNNIRLSDERISRFLDDIYYGRQDRASRREKIEELLNEQIELIAQEAEKMGISVFAAHLRKGE